MMGSNLVTIYQNEPVLSEPTGTDVVPETTREYFRTRNKMRAFTLVHDAFAASGISQATLAARLGLGPDRISRLLGAPGNWTLDTLSDLLFAISGAEAAFHIDHPLREPARGKRQPDWLDGGKPGPSRRGTLGNLDQPPRKGRASR